MKPEIIFTIPLFGLIIYFGSQQLIRLFRDRKTQKCLLAQDDLETKDLRVYAQSYKRVFFSFGENFDYLKFRFTDNEVFIYMRNSFPGVYNGPFLIKEKAIKNYSYFAKLDLINFSVSGTDVKISFGHRNFIGVKYNFHLKNVSERDIELLKLNLC